MRKAPILLALLLVAGAAAAATDEQDFTQVERGRYLTVVGDCQACHTAPGGQPFAGGRPIETPFGTVLSGNITPDRDTGLGAWGDQDFIDLLQKGRGRFGYHVYPAMPYTYTARVTRDDALAIRAYLATLPAVRNPVQSDQLPFPFGVRASMAAWDRLFFREGVFQPDPNRDADWNRGAYLVTGLAHCGMCHTPKNALGGDEDGQALQGYSLQGWFAPNITDDARQGLGAWSADDIVEYLASGHNRFAAAAGPMAEEVTYSSSRMTPADLRAIAAYLKSMPGQNHQADAPVAADDPAMRTGAAIYADACSACHTPDGSGVAGMFPALRAGASTQGREPTSVIRVILRGAQTVGTAAAPTGPAMPSFAWQMDDAQVAAVATYVRNAWGNAAPAVTAAQVRAERASLEHRSSD
jgi:mono/diheme cytochrome c family protein